MGGTFETKRNKSAFRDLESARDFPRISLDQLASSTSFPGNDYYLSKSVVSHCDGRISAPAIKFIDSAAAIGHSNSSTNFNDSR